MSEHPQSLLMTAVGLFMAVHCTFATMREYKAGRALGGAEFGNWDRAKSPLGFWLIMAGNVAAAMMGLFLTLFGLMGLLQ